MIFTQSRYRLFSCLLFTAVITLLAAAVIAAIVATIAVTLTAAHAASTAASTAASNNPPSKTEQDQQAQASEIIRRADRVRAPEEPFRYQLILQEYRNGQALTERQQQLDVSMRFYKPSEQRQQGEAKALVRFVAPVRDKGKALLSDQDKMWYFSPDLRRPIPISRQQRLLGQVSNGDVVAADFDYAYIATLMGIEPCGDTQCYQLSLQRRWPSVTYPAINYWVETETYHPYRADFLSTEGVLLKRSYYQDYQQVLGRLRPMRIIVEDGLAKTNYTRMRYSQVRLESLPDSHFQKEYLLRLAD